MKKLFLILLIGIMSINMTSCQREVEYAAVMVGDPPQLDMNITYEQFLQEYNLTLRLNQTNEQEEDRQVLENLRNDVIQYQIYEKYTYALAEQYGLDTLSELDRQTIGQSVEEVFADWVIELGLRSENENSDITDEQLLQPFFQEVGISRDVVEKWVEGGLISRRLEEHLYELSEPADTQVAEYHQQLVEDAKTVYESDPAAFAADVSYLDLYLPEGTRTATSIYVKLSQQRRNQIDNLRTNYDTAAADKLFTQSLQEISDITQEVVQLLDSGYTASELEEKYKDNPDIVIEKNVPVIPNYDQFGLFTLSQIGDRTLPLPSDEGNIIAIYEGVYQQSEQARQNVLDAMAMQLQYQNNIDLTQRLYDEMEAKYPYEINYELVGIVEGEVG